MDVELTWRRIEAFLAHTYPRALNALRRGAAHAALREVERELGVELPESCRRSFMCHDGQEATGPWLVDGGLLCSLATALEERRDMIRMQETNRFAGFEIDVKADASIRSDTWWRPRWLPIVAQDGDYLVVDLDPAPGGRTGQVFAFSHVTGAGRVAADDLAGWLNLFAYELEAGIVRPRPGEWDVDAEPDNDADLDEPDGEDADRGPTGTWPL